MNCKKETMLLYAVTDRAWVGKQTFYQQIEAALKGGATCVQLREKKLPEDVFLEEAIAVKKLCHTYGIPFIINDKAEIALKCGADGVHIGQKDRKPEQVRSLIGPEMIMGVSAHTLEQALRAQEAGADYLGVGAMFATSTKTDAANTSYETLKQICNRVTIPVVAIGGIQKYNIMKLSGSGVNGVALVSAIFAADDIEKECRELKILAKTMTEE